MAQYKYISNISEEEFLKNTVIPCVDEDNFVCILVKNALPKTISSSFNTDNLEIKTNRVLTRSAMDYFFHIIKCKKTDVYSLQQFEVIFTYIFEKIENPITDVQLASLITSIEDYFKLTADKDKNKIQIGVYGELLAILFLYENGYPRIIDKFHTDFFSKHDVEISAITRLEIKTTDTEKRIHHFKHNQIMRTDVDVYVASVMLEKSREGVALLALFDKVMPLFIDPESLFALEKLKKKCGINRDDPGISCSFAYAFENIRFFSSNDLPKIPISVVDGVSNIEYDVDCSLAKDIKINDLILLFK